jgi:hypothetical protein
MLNVFPGHLMLVQSPQGCDWVPWDCLGLWSGRLPTRLFPVGWTQAFVQKPCLSEEPISNLWFVAGPLGKYLGQQKPPLLTKEDSSD